ncbi:hypothetical protein C1645_736371 [Glomus cerebriforme]|uniref:Uncharacterized protein n=1 Tax=Glomus cerebriforme TaxID=658196 RepID=A0A397T7T3_9GLOM|nr:hypothetical protein C1645_736371 [Glomus cerebriforme]
MGLRNKDYIETIDHIIDLETEWEIERYMELKNSMKAFVKAMLKKQKNGMENKERIKEIPIIDNMKNSEENQNKSKRKRNENEEPRQNKRIRKETKGFKRI